MKPSLETICTARVVLAEKMLRDPDPRLRAAFNELRQVMVEENERALSQDTLPTSMFHRLQAG